MEEDKFSITSPIMNICSLIFLVVLAVSVSTVNASSEVNEVQQQVVQVVGAVKHFFSDDKLGIQITQHLKELANIVQNSRKRIRQHMRDYLNTLLQEKN